MVVVALLIGAGAFVVLRTDDEGGPEPDPKLVAEVDACDVPVELLERAWRGYYPGRSGDVIAIEQYPATHGTRHSSPWPYTQEIPLILYGPGYIKAGEYGGEATTADLAPTFAELLDFDGLGRRDGHVLEDALLPRSQRNGRPKLLVTLVWDGGGDNVLARWPNSWPELKRFMAKSAVYRDGIAGSSPSITPSIHSNMGTGYFPSTHGQADIRMRVRGKMVDAWEGFSPKYLESSTLGDEGDVANDNAPKVGVFARDSWHAGMIGHGAAFPGGDQDLGVFDTLGQVSYHSKAPYFYMPDYFQNFDELQGFVDEVDTRDGKDDDQWLGNSLAAYRGEIRFGPAWPPFQTVKMFELLEKEGFGADDMPDLFYTNYKSADLTGHEWNMESPEMRDVIEAQDAEIPKIISGLDRLVGKDNYVLAFTADHGMTPFAKAIDGWSIVQTEVTADIQEEFDTVTPDESILASNRGYYLWLDKKELRKEGKTAEDVAAFLRDYRVGDNVRADRPLPPTWENRAEQRLFLTALTPRGLEEALECARSKQGG